MPVLVAQTGVRSAGEVVVWVIALALVLALGAVVILWIRTRMLRETSEDPDSHGLLDAIRRAHRRGDISDAEFARARDRLVGRLSGRRRARAKLLRGEVFDDGTIRAREGFDLLGDPLPMILPDQPPDAPE